MNPVRALVLQLFLGMLNLPLVTMLFFGLAFAAVFPGADEVPGGFLPGLTLATILAAGAGVEIRQLSDNRFWRVLPELQPRLRAAAAITVLLVCIPNWLLALARQEEFMTMTALTLAGALLALAAGIRFGISVLGWALLAPVVLYSAWSGIHSGLSGSAGFIISGAILLGSLLVASAWLRAFRETTFSSQRMPHTLPGSGKGQVLGWNFLIRTYGTLVATILIMASILGDQYPEGRWQWGLEMLIILAPVMLVVVASDHLMNARGTFRRLAVLPRWDRMRLFQLAERSLLRTVAVFGLGPLVVAAVLSRTASVDLAPYLPATAGLLAILLAGSACVLGAITAREYGAFRFRQTGVAIVVAIVNTVFYLDISPDAEVLQFLPWVLLILGLWLLIRWRVRHAWMHFSIERIGHWPRYGRQNWKRERK